MPSSRRQERGDAALKDYTKRFDGVQLDCLRVDPAAVEAAWKAPRSPCVMHCSWPTGASARSTANNCRTTSSSRAPMGNGLAGAGGR